MNKISALITILLLATSAFAADVKVAGPEIIRTSAGKITLHGTAAGSTKVTWQTSDGATGTASGRDTWEAAIPLCSGPATIIVKAYDANGASAWVGVVAISSAAVLPQQPAL